MAATVLVVEDERKPHELVRSYLERAGFVVLSTGSGAGAITLATSASPDLVILGLRLPDVPGETVAREIARGRSGADPDAYREKRRSRQDPRLGTGCR
jgi:DNA-binding response OmpR family regulator